MKLVRDLVPEKYPQNTYHVAGRREFVAMLRMKIVEEAAEVVGSRNDEELVAELADVLEAMLALTRAVHIPWSKVNDVRNRKREALGGFGEGWVMTEYVEGES